jgi:hypothetical protein
MPDRVLAEFPSEAAIVEAIVHLRTDGFDRLDAYMPFPSHEVEHALGKGRSRLPRLIFAIGISAAAGAYALQWFVVDFLYPLVVGGRTAHFPLAFFIITFEMGVLFSALTAFVGTLFLGNLFRLTDEVQHTPGFRSATRDRFWLEVLVSDPRYDAGHTEAVLRDLGASRIEHPEAYT